MCDGPEAGLTQIDAVLEQGELANYYLGRTAETRAAPGKGQKHLS
jgi:predicted RNA polymerase sigma factor